MYKRIIIRYEFRRRFMETFAKLITTLNRMTDIIVV